MTFREQMNKNRTQPTAEELAEKAATQAENERRDRAHAEWKKLSDTDKMAVVNESVAGCHKFLFNLLGK